MKRLCSKRFWAILAAMLMLFQLLPLSAAAAEPKTDSSGESDEAETYTVRYVNGFGKTLYKKEVKSGESVKPYDKKPQQPGFTFTCWDRKLPDKITEDITVTALWAIDKSVPLTLTVFADARIRGNAPDSFRQLVSTALAARGRVAALATTGNLVERYDDQAAWDAICGALWSLPDDMRFYAAAGPDDVNGAAGDYAPFLRADLCRACRLNFYDGGAVWFERSSREGIMLLGVGYREPAETGVGKEIQDMWMKFVNDAVRVHAGYSVVLLVSDYTDADGNLTPFGKLLEEQVVAVNDNVRLIVSGGADAPSLVEKSYGGRRVNTVLLGGGAEGLTNLVFNLTDRSVDVTPVSSGTGFSIDNAF